MVYTCFICKKRSDKSQGLSFHRFPSNTTNRQQWLDILGQSKHVPGKGAAVCSSHFDSKCFRYGLVNGKEFLKPGSKPTLNLGKQDQINLTTNISNKIDESFTNNRPDDWNSISSQLLTNTPNTEPLVDSQSNDISDNQLVADLSIGKPTILNKPRPETPLCKVIPKKKMRITKITWEELSKSPKEGKMLWEATKQELLNHRKKIECLQRKVRRFRQKVSSLKLMTKHLLKKNLIMTNEAKLLHSTMDPVTEALFKQIVSKKKKVAEFPLSLRIFAATLLFLSPKAYTYTRKAFSLSLPHPSTVRKWFVSLDGRPRISKAADGTCLLQIPKTLLDKSALIRQNDNIIDNDETLNVFPSPILDHDYCIPSGI